MKTKVIIEKTTESSTVMKMEDMEPGQICIMIDSGEYVMRTLSTDKFEVMSLESFYTDECWEGKVVGRNIDVKPAPSGTKIIFEVI